MILKKTLYIYNQKNTKLYKKKKIKKKKMENGCASKVVFADSSIGLSSHP